MVASFTSYLYVLERRVLLLDREYVRFEEVSGRRRFGSIICRSEIFVFKFIFIVFGESGVILEFVENI